MTIDLTFTSGIGSEADYEQICNGYVASTKDAIRRGVSGGLVPSLFSNWLLLGIGTLKRYYDTNVNG